MAKQMRYFDPFGNDNLESYWRVDSVNLSVTDRMARIVFVGYRDAEARQERKAVIGSKDYTITDSAFDAMYAAHLSQGGPNLLQLVYQYAAVTLDTWNGSAWVGFFDGAVDV